VVRTDVAAMSSSLRDAFTSAGPEVEERRTGTGRAFLVAGRAMGQIDESPALLRVRLWLVEKDRRSVEGRPTFDSASGWLHVVSDDDVAFVRGLIPLAYRAAVAGGAGAAPTGPGGAPWDVTGPREAAGEAQGTARPTPARPPTTKRAAPRTARK
jgi:hypothetical protein